jgi:hypothetical protein
MRASAALCCALLGLAAAAVQSRGDGNIFGIGVYYPPSRNLQHAFARNLTGPGGWVTVLTPAGINPGFAAGAANCHLPPRGSPPGSVAPSGAMLDAFARNLSVVLIVQPFYPVDGCGVGNGTWKPAMYIRDLADDPATHLSYTNVAQTYVEVVRSLPKPPPGSLSKVYVQLGNEMNGMWSCSCSAIGLDHGHSLPNDCMPVEIAALEPGLVLHQ